MPKRAAKFVQLVAVKEELYALDAGGGVWVLSYGDPPMRWCQITSEREWLTDETDQGC